MLSLVEPYLTRSFSDENHASLEVISTSACHGGVQVFLKHSSEKIGLPMRFGIYLPPQAAYRRVPVLYYLAGLTCTEETFFAKGQAAALAATLGLALVSPDTSPRTANIAGEADDWTFGLGASFYVDATELPWSTHFKMYSYVTRELPQLVASHFRVDPAQQGIFGHSMGGHGALVCAVRNPKTFRSVSAFAPVANPMRCPWGQNAFKRYLGSNQSDWCQYDATELLRQWGYPGRILIDQGGADKFLREQLQPSALVAAASEFNQAVNFRLHAGYDHSYYFVSSFMEDHLRHHYDALSDKTHDAVVALT
ncbi:S-formylglutathione hydrolase [Undibacterium arcticum]|uniref:S-formylglutathione hydrolase n=1 Tax=Undibacterium arcticum TaxID=1762892 RepID=A0ABV7F1V2_9BURK